MPVLLAQNAVSHAYTSGGEHILYHLGCAQAFSRNSQTSLRP